VVNLTTDGDLIRSSGLLSEPDALLFDLVRGLLARSDVDRLLVSVTSPWTLLTELFTVRGAGTLLKRGTEILRHEDYASIDQSRLKDLLESSFRRPLLPGFLQRKPLAVYLQPDYRGAAILEPSRVGPLLSKFAVDPVAQGEGMGRDLWQRIVRGFPSLVWRARRDNPINSFYVTECDGMARAAKWQVFWRRVELTRVAAVVDELVALPQDFG
jgi:acetylglutamate kinase